MRVPPDRSRARIGARLLCRVSCGRRLQQADLRAPNLRRAGQMRARRAGVRAPALGAGEDCSKHGRSHPGRRGAVGQAERRPEQRTDASCRAARRVRGTSNCIINCAHFGVFASVRHPSPLRTQLHRNSTEERVLPTSKKSGRTMRVTDSWGSTYSACVVPFKLKPVGLSPSNVPGREIRNVYARRGVWWSR
eukprot:scaffold59617_cov79-Phaeocystis_antarctica.AAC.3